MKKVVMVVACALAVSQVFAQVLPKKVQANPEHKNTELYKFQYSSKGQLQQDAVEVRPNIDNRATEDMSVKSRKQLVRHANASYATPKATGIKAFYWKPEGSFFLGVSRQGQYQYVGITGAWLDEEELAWVFQGRSENYTDLLYKTYISHRLPDNYFTDPVTGNWHDTLVATVRGDVSSTYSYDMPFLTVNNGQERDTFVLSSNHKNPLMTELSNREFFPPMTLAGADCPYKGHEDKMWPMTNAMSVDCNHGNLVLSAPYNTQPLEYFIGTTDVTVTENGASTTVVPDGLEVAYEQPQAALYVKDITLQLEAYEMKNGKATVVAPTMADKDTLWITVESTMGAKIAESYATKADLTQVTSGTRRFAMLQFNFASDTTVYGEQRSIGFNVNEAFNVKITGMSKCEGNFSVVVANAPYGSNTFVLTASDEKLQYADVEAYVMLNGLYPTMIDGYTDVSDTLVIKELEMADGIFENAAIYAEFVADNYTLVPAVYSYVYPVDTLKQVSNWQFDAPDWLTWGFSDADWDGEEYSDIITIYFFAEDLPAGVAFREGRVSVSFKGLSKSYYVYQGTKPAELGAGNMTGLQNSLAADIRIATLDNAFALAYPADFNQVEVYTVSGAKVATYELSEEGSMTIDNAAMSNGVYIFRFMGASQAVVRAMK